MSYTVVQAKFDDPSGVDEYENHTLFNELAGEFNALGISSFTFRRQNAVDVQLRTGAKFTIQSKEVRCTREGFAAFAEESQALAFIKAYAEKSDGHLEASIGQVNEDFDPAGWDYT